MTESDGQRGRLGDLIARAAERAARVWSSATERVNFRTTAEVLAWLAAVVAFALLFSLWITVALAATALAAGAVRAAEQHVRTALVALPLVAVFVGVAYLLTRPPPNRVHATAALHEPRTRKWVSIGYGVQAALEIKNRTFRNRWGTMIEAEGNDRLQFRLLLRNLNVNPATPRVARLFVSQPDEDGGGPHVISFSFGLGSNGPFTSGPEVRIVAQSNNSMSEFHATPLRYGETYLAGPYAEPVFSGPKAEALYAPRPRSPPAQEETGAEYATPSIAAHGQQVMSFTGSYDTPANGPIGGGDVLKIKNPRGPGNNRYVTTASAVPGDRLQIWAHFHNAGFRGTEVDARIRIGTEEHGRVGRITLYESENGGAFSEHGFGTVNSGTGAPIKLTVQPGSTELIAPKTACSNEKAKPLPDGIAEGGVDVGDVEGWVPRDPCKFEELDRNVVFTADVR
jgi:hypothetical protein